MFILKKGHQPGVYVPLRALFLVYFKFQKELRFNTSIPLKQKDTEIHIAFSSANIIVGIES